MMMPDRFYTDERNAQIVLALMKAYGIRKMVLSPGSTNLAVVGSVQNDPYFQLWSAVDERHAAYLACGIADESGEPVVISCTGATAARNYMPGMTEAYYRRLPILCLTSTQEISHLGRGYIEMTDRTRPPADVAKLSVRLPPVYTDHEAAECEQIATRAFLELFGEDRGPVHICLETCYAGTFMTRELPELRKLTRVHHWSEDWPILQSGMKVAIWVGSGSRYSEKEIQSLETFAEHCDAVVLCDPTSCYQGCLAVRSALLCVQSGVRAALGELKPDLVVAIGGLSGDQMTRSFLDACNANVWRVTVAGKGDVPLNGLSAIFEMSDKAFFDHYSQALPHGCSQEGFAHRWQERLDDVRSKLPDMPFSNCWIAQRLTGKIPAGACVQLGIYNTLTTWSYAPVRNDVEYRANVGGFGIDGCLSTALGASFANPDRLQFAIVGDLAFFYDLNAVGNRHLGKNLRILLVNNGAGSTFNMYFHQARKVFGDQTNEFSSAARHFGNQSPQLVRHLAEDLGFEYLAASNKDEFTAVEEHFVSDQCSRPILLECFVDMKDETGARYAADHIEPVKPTLKSHVKGFVKKTLFGQ